MKKAATSTLALGALALAVSAGLALGGSQAAAQEERVIKIVGFGAKSGVLRQFGLNSEAALRAAAKEINDAGGVKLGDGGRGRIEIGYYDDRCNVDEGISLVRRFAAADWLAGVGTTCSPVVEAVFGIQQKRAGDAKDSGVQFPVFTDVAMKIGLARQSDWAFRNIPDEIELYRQLFAWVKQHHPDARTVYGGVEENFVHSNQTWYSIMKARANQDGYDVKGEAKWLLDDTNFTAQVREMKAANADIVAISAHPFTACGVLKEMARQGVKPKVLLGLTSISSPETLDVCAQQAEGLIIPTSYAPVNPQARAAADATAQFKGYADLHSMSAWENLYAIKAAIESEGVLGKPDTVKADRDRIRAGLSKQTQMDGLLGISQRTPERESIKPFVFVQATGAEWAVVHAPVQ
ncbi:Branched-chain amino acid ABC transporter, amino acid-binding protein (TC 3.A.1.4.1) [plant metagenome]|uniref:Branched-chain amino acid ABC transporter, amino acid-binding protein (TC 3.A.1.4.1) n=1 Tax=plant metagenome TaxID=1297885 RepID=A0A484NWG7_9ZZZZ